MFEVLRPDLAVQRLVLDTLVDPDQGTEEIDGKGGVEPGKDFDLLFAGVGVDMDGGSGMRKYFWISRGRVFRPSKPSAGFWVATKLKPSAASIRPPSPSRRERVRLVNTESKRLRTSGELRFISSATKVAPIRRARARGPSDQTKEPDTGSMR